MALSRARLRPASFLRLRLRRAPSQSGAIGNVYGGLPSNLIFPMIVSLLHIVPATPHSHRWHTEALGSSAQIRCVKVREQQPAAYMKICALLVPREMKVEHAGGVKAMSDEQIEEAIAAIQAMLAARAGETAKVIEGEAEVVPSLPAPARPTKAS
jgi:hypothetical protein